MKRILLVPLATALISGMTGSTRADAPEPKSPPTISSITSKMSGVAVDLSKTKTGEPVQREQKVIVRDLDELIASLEKECQNCNGMKRNNPRRGLPDSVIRNGTGGIGDLIDPRQGEKDWSKLPNRERDRILQSMSEGFPPEYRTVLERYYRRLAEEKTVAPGTDSAQPKKAPESDKP
jgi:hypothetical protein